ncbi:MAG TPA: tetratricopeptide repeat protein [Bacteroidales bacterium]|nr:tetratricopeptide repeat protein [Bacteroidales bacterium]
MKYGLRSLILLVFTTFSLLSQAQTMADAIAAYNKGVELQATDTKGAIAALEQCYTISEKLGAEGDSLKTVVGKAIPVLYNKQANDLVEAKKYVEAISAYQQVVNVAQKYGDTETAVKANSILPQLYYGAGLDAYNQKNDANAVSYLEKAVAADSTNTKPMYVLAVVYQRMNNAPKFLSTLDKFLTTAKSQNDEASVEKANNLGKRYYTVAYANNAKANKLNESIESLKKALQYAPEDKDLNFFLGQSYNKAKKYDLAIETLKKALSLETGSAEEKAKYYFELGNAYVAKSDNTNACDAFKNAQYGKYAENAKYQITTVLKCK